MNHHNYTQNMPDKISHKNDDFAGYRWSYFSSLGDGPLRVRAEKFLESIDWGSLIQRASAKRNGIECRLLPQVGLGYNHMVRVVEFADQVQWVARLRMPHLPGNCGGATQARDIIESEYSTIHLVRKESQIPVPHVHVLEADPNSNVGAQFMLIDCLRGNAGIDLSMNIPPEHKLNVYSRMAEIQVCNHAALEIHKPSNYVSLSLKYSVFGCRKSERLLE